MKPFEILCMMAWRNLWRNRRRTLLTGGTIAGGLSLLLLLLGLGEGTHRQMLRNAVRLGGAHVAVQARGYQSRKDVGLTLAAGRVEELAGAGRVVPRMFASGLASSADGSTGISLIGIEPGLEARVSLLDEKVVAGSFLRDGSSRAAVIGHGVARRLRLAPGSKFVLMAQGPASPEIQSVLLRVAGILRSGVEEIDESTVLVPLATAQDLLGLPGRIHQAALILEDDREAGREAQRLAAVAGADAEVLRWDELMPELRDLIRIDVAGLWIIDAVFFLIIAFLVMNTLLMSVLERSREFALLDAAGLNPVRRFLLVLLEGAWIGGLSALCGALAGYAVHAWFARRGLYLYVFFEKEFSAAGTSIDPVVYPVLPPGRAAAAVGMVFLATLLLALVPAWRAATKSNAHLLGRA